MGSYSIRDVGLVNRLERMEKDMAQMKNRQFVGKKTLATYTTKLSTMLLSNDAWYFDPVGPPQLQALEHDVTFEANEQLNPYGVLTAEFYDLGGQLIVNTDSQSGPVIDSLYILLTAPDSKRLKWRIQVVGPAAPKWYVKYVVNATDKGVVGTSDDLIHY